MTYFANRRYIVVTPRGKRRACRMVLGFSLSSLDEIFSLTSADIDGELNVMVRFTAISLWNLVIMRMFS